MGEAMAIVLVLRHIEYQQVPQICASYICIFVCPEMIFDPISYGHVYVVLTI